MKQLIDRLQKEYPHIQTIIGHRDTSPDLDGNGCIEPQEYIKDCPCFDVRTWLRNISLCTVCTGLFCLAASCGSHKSVARISEQELSSAVRETVQMKQTHELEQIVSKQLNDSSSDKNLLIDEYLEKTILIRRKKKNESDTNRQISHKAESNTKTDTIYVERHTTDNRSTTLQKQQDKKRSSGTNTVFLWITGAGVLAGGGYLIAVRYRKAKEKRQKNS